MFFSVLTVLRRSLLAPSVFLPFFTFSFHVSSFHLDLASALPLPSYIFISSSSIVYSYTPLGAGFMLIGTTDVVF